MHSSARAIRLAWPSFREPAGRVLGLPFVVAACSPAVWFEWQACLAAGVLAVLANFIVFVPLTALMLNGGQAMRSDVEIPALTPRAYAVLLLLWTATAWLFAGALQVR